MGSVWSCGRVYGAESFQRKQTQRETQGLVGDCTWDKPVKCLFPNGTGLEAPKGAAVACFQMRTLWSQGNAEQLLFVNAHVNIYHMWRKCESLDVGSSICPLRSHDGRFVCFCLWVGEYIFAL